MSPSVVPVHGSGKRPLQGAARCATLRAMRILVSNDDGAEAPGLRALAEALLELGEVVVCAPDREQSATSRSISLHRPLRIERLPPGTLLNVNVPPGTPQGAQITAIGRRSYAAAVVEKLDPRGRAYYWIGGDEQAHENVPGSDCNAVFDRRLISVTPLHLDLTRWELVEELKGWELPGLVRHRR